MLVIYGKLDGLNNYTRACRSGWQAGNRMKKTNEETIGWYIKSQKIKPVTGPVRLVFRWYDDGKRDVDNIAFAKKFILDALVKNQILEDDNQKIVKGFLDEFYIDKTNPRIEVEILSEKSQA